MFIEVVIDGEIINRVHINLDPFNDHSLAEFKVREELINAYISELKILYPKAYFQLAFESRINLIEE